MKQRVINLSHYEVLQLKRGENIRIQFKDTILVLAGEKKEIKRKSKLVS